MNWWELTFKEIRFRWAGFALGLTAVATAVTCLVGALTLLQAHELLTERILAQRERATREKMRLLEDDVRGIMRELGYNLLILPVDQNLAQLRSDGCPDTFMPEEYVHRLGRSSINTLNHLLPILQQQAVWPEYSLPIILSGTSGQVPVLNKGQHLLTDGTYRNPIMKTIPDGALIVGAAIGKELNLRGGDIVTLIGEKYRIARVNPPNGGTDDIVVWCDLSKVQHWLGLEGQINGILALECICQPKLLGGTTEKVQQVLPDTQVLAFSSRIVARADVRRRAKETARQAAADERAHRAAIGRQLERFTAILSPLTAAGAAIWIFFLVLANVRERQAEIGILRAMGVGEAKIIAVFLLKAALMGAGGALVGYCAGVAAGALWGGVSVFSEDFKLLLNPHLFAFVLVAAPLLCVVAGGLPALRAAHLDPAVVLRED